MNRRVSNRTELLRVYVTDLEGSTERTARLAAEVEHALAEGAPNTTASTSEALLFRLMRQIDLATCACGRTKELRAEISEQRRLLADLRAELGALERMLAANPKG